MGMFRAEFEFPDEDDGDNAFACCSIFYTGWKCAMEFYPMFFQRPLELQLHTVVHEHVHLLTHPLEQAVLRYQRQMSEASANQLGEAVVVGREIMADHATVPLYRLLHPHILKVL